MWRRSDLIQEHSRDMIIKAWITKMQEATKAQQKQHLLFKQGGF